MYKSTDRLDMTIAVDWAVKPQRNNNNNNNIPLNDMQG